MKMSEILGALKLRTHPFRPKADAAGQPFDDPDLLLKPLDPRLDPRLAEFYFDHYDWQGSIRQIRSGTFTNFPTQKEMVNRGPMMILITGADNTGRESLRNLILHEIGSQFGNPLLVKATLDTFNAAENIKLIATLFLSAYRREEALPPHALLRESFDEQAGEKDPGARNNYSTLFQLWRDDVLPACKRPLVLLAEGGDSHDLWRQIYESTSHLFRFVIVTTKNEPHANACYLGLSGKNRVLVKAKLLGQQWAREYLAARLADERPAAAAPDDLTPFSQEALNALYEPGIKFKPGDAIEWSIGWLNETFSAIVDSHVSALLDLVEKQGKVLEDLEPDELLIKADAVRAARNRLNQT
jgi:hypothetical protein